MIMFSVLQDLTPEIKKMTGHYYLIVLNLTSGRFEVMDSLRREGDKALMADARTIIGSIKHLWATNYSESKINISKYKIVHITTPRQLTTYDCGFFMLKYIECWNGRRMAAINPSDMPALRKIFLKKWMDYVENRIDWEELLFPVRNC
nr:putative ubiquitin-like-specific protease 1B [Lolium perenne]